MGQQLVIYEKIQFTKPVMLATWNGVGQVGLGAVEYIRRKLASFLFAEIDMSFYLPSEGIMVKNGLVVLQEAPKARFYYLPQPEIIFFECNASNLGLQSFETMMKFINFCIESQVGRIYTGAAIASPISVKQESHVYGFSTKETIRDSLPGYGIEIFQEGYVTGLNGLLLGMAREKDIEAICLLATLPQYAINFNNPKASKALIEAFEHILKIDIDKTEIDEEIKKAEQKMVMIEERIRELFPMLNSILGEINKDLDEITVPKYVMEKIEILFKEVEADKSKATLLKEELDRWKLYELYEDRFLNLFR